MFEEPAVSSRDGIVVDMLARLDWRLERTDVIAVVGVLVGDAVVVVVAAAADGIVVTVGAVSSKECELIGRARR